MRAILVLRLPTQLRALLPGFGRRSADVAQQVVIEFGERASGASATQPKRETSEPPFNNGVAEFTWLWNEQGDRHGRMVLEHFSSSWADARCGGHLRYAAQMMHF